jgi:NAD(P)-dependent dehydrogenase (short-subunit alcohol dehydrogenase family)
VDLGTPPAFGLDGRRALVTGAGRGIGLAAAAALAQFRAEVMLVARTRDEIESAASALGKAGHAARWATLDVLDTQAVRSFVAHNGPFEILVNNAGTNRPKPMLDVTEEDFDAVMTLNVRAAFFVAQAVAAGLVAAKKTGSIINVSSQMGLVGAANRTIYCASKHALEGMTKAMAVEFGPQGIRVNTLCPTFVETPMTQLFFADAKFRAAVESKIKLGRIGKVEDLVGAIVFLASDASSLMTGSALTIDGGWTAD